MAKTATPSSSSIPPPPPRTSTKGLPPKHVSETAALPNSLNKPAKSAKVGLNTEVTAEFRAELKVWAAAHGMKMGEAIQKGFELLKQKHR